MLKPFLRVLFPFVFLLSCNSKSVFTEVKVNNQYTLTVPNYLHACTDIHKTASLQLQNQEKDIYLIVIDEQKTNDQQFTLQYYYYNIITQPFIKQIKFTIVDHDIIHKKISGNNALITNIRGLINKKQVYYKLIVIETPRFFYQIIIWTNDNKKEYLENDFKKITESFKEKF